LPNDCSAHRRPTRPADYFCNQGIQRDFFTSAHIGPDFGELLAEQFADFWEHLDRPDPFTLVEMGAGQGLLVQDIVRYLHRHHYDCFTALRYIIVEKSPALIAAQQQRLQQLMPWGQASQAEPRLTWKTWAEIAPDSIVGCCFSNELVDAFPVHQVVVEAGLPEALQEIYVTQAPNQAVTEFTETIAPLSTPRLAEYFTQLDLNLLAPPYPDSYRTEVNLASLDWITTIANRLQRGYLLTLDYGYSAERYYRPSRSQGTLQCYYQHRHHNDPYSAIGLQDITAHVNFTALEQQGQISGLQTLGFTQQGLFLMALGLGNRIAALSTPTPDLTVQDILQRRESLHALIDPAGLGNFGVLIQAKGLSKELGKEPSAQVRQIKGLMVPPL
jgi:SAM-dependent MidA family methyltransferase